MPPAERSGAPGAIRGSYEPLAELYSDWRAELLGSGAGAALLSGVPSHAALAVDAGCGPGLVAAKMAGRVDRLLAFDASPGMVLVARRRLAEAGIDNVALLVADATALPLRPASVDLVVACYLLHLTDIHRTLPALAAAVKPGGTFYIADSVRRWWQLHGTFLGWLIQAVAWPARVALGGRRHQASRLARMLWSGGWRQIHLHSGFSPGDFAAACRRYLPACDFSRTGPNVKVIWAARPTASPGGAAR